MAGGGLRWGSFATPTYSGLNDQCENNSMRYRRADVTGGTYFFTVNLAQNQAAAQRRRWAIPTNLTKRALL